MENAKIGIIGAGRAGMLLAARLTAAGFSVAVASAGEVRELPAGAAAVTPFELADGSDVIISTLDDIAATNEIFIGTSGIWDNIRNNATVIITGAVGPECCTRLYAKSLLKQFKVIDAAVITAGDAAESLVLLAGGDENVYKDCRPVLEAISKDIFYVGSIGTGQAYKLINDLAAGGCEAAVRESLNLGLTVGLKLNTMLEILQKSLAGGFTLPALASNYQTGRRTAAAAEISLAGDMAKAFGAALPLQQCIGEIDVKASYPAYNSEMERKP